MFDWRLIHNLISWLGRSQQIVAASLLAVFLFSCLGVISAAHTTRQMYGDLQKSQSSLDDLDSEYEKLLLEQSAWADYTRIDKLAASELGMLPPVIEEVVVVNNVDAKRAASDRAIHSGEAL